jgi:hypothetical protein
MSCGNGTCSSTVVSSATMGLAMHPARASSFVARRSSRGMALSYPVSTAETERNRQMFLQWRGYRRTAPKPNSKKINQDAIPDTTHIDPKCVWGDEGPVND